jgi:hypothetical protein
MRGNRHLIDKGALPRNYMAFYLFDHSLLSALARVLH